MSSDKNSLSDSDETRIPAETRSRILQLSSCHSIVQISMLSGMPNASAIYQEFAVDREFARAFKRERREYWRARRQEIADLLARWNQGDPTFVFVALKRLRRLKAREPQEYDLTLLTDDDIERLETILRKALPPHRRIPS